MRDGVTAFHSYHHTLIEQESHRGVSDVIGFSSATILRVTPRFIADASAAATGLMFKLYAAILIRLSAPSIAFNTIFNAILSGVDKKNGNFRCGGISHDGRAHCNGQREI
ncbi:hypothetical protein IFU25_16080 [Pantoea agglomerans]|uniref:hypothetical protein n=1 Tax=Enterobacter agglomerans TaxID=549 RepID=UPI00177E9005|nr:hypothetical protein [Pantoea agglomerans]MBD8183203.1 hypothetical protein [Pantoea agglomerans]